MAAVEGLAMRLKTSKHENATIIEIDGRLDGMTARAFEEDVTAAVPEGDGAVVCDLSAVSYISSAGLRAVLVVAKRLDKNGKSFSVCGHDGSVAEVFRISGFEKIIRMYPKREDALAAAGA